MRFGGLTAVNEVSFSVEEGTIAGLIGPNGAGKTTCFSLITGFLPPNGGRVRFRGRLLTGREIETLKAGGATTVRDRKGRAPRPRPVA